MTHIYTTCALPNCNQLIKNWRTHFCCVSHAAKYGHSSLPKLPRKDYPTQKNKTHTPRLKPWRQLSLCLPTPVVLYKDRTPEQKGKWVAYVTARQQRIKKATPAWTDLTAIKQFYIEAQRLTKETGIPHEVDHIIPIQGKLVSGLHVPANLQILTEKENQIKNARYEV
jgi:5-methylcytosine-specific restriction endonuclease McrA